MIWLLMNEHNGKTHPEIANAIADHIGATSEERDSIVHSKHRGTYVPIEERELLKAQRRRFLPPNAKGVVAVDKVGNIIATYPTAAEAARRIGVSRSVVLFRCNRYGFCRDEFKPYGMTFRFEAEWLPMSMEERRADFELVKEGGFK